MPDSIGDHPVRVALLVVPVLAYAVALVATRGRVNRWLFGGGLRSRAVDLIPAALVGYRTVQAWAVGRTDRMAVLGAATAALVLVGCRGAAYGYRLMRLAPRWAAATGRGLRDLVGWRPPGPRWWWAGLVGVLIGGAVLVFLRVHEAGLFIYGDEARHANWARWVFRDRPMTGVPTTADLYGADSLFQLGPMELYLLHPFVRVFGIDVGPTLYALTVNMVAVLTSVWSGALVAGRRGAAAIAVVMVLLFSVMYAGRLAGPLNTYLVAATFFACYCLSWALATGREIALAPLAVAMSFVAQTHVAYGVAAAIVGGVALTVAAARTADRSRLLDATALACTALVVAWILPAWDQLAGSGNAGHYLRSEVPHRGLSGAANAATALFQPTMWTKRFEFHEVDLVGGRPVHLVVGMAVLGGGLALAGRGRPTGTGWTAAAVIAATAVVGAFLPPDVQPSNHLYFLRVAGWFLGAVLVVVVVAALPLRRPTARTAASVVALVLVVAAWTRYLPRAVPVDHHRPDRLAARALTAQLRTALPQQGDVLVVFRGGISSNLIAETVVARLDRPGRHLVGFPGDFGDPTSGVVVVQGPADRDTNGPLLARYRPSGAEEAEDRAEALRDWVRAHPPLRTNPILDGELELYLDGIEPTMCLDDVHADHTRLLDLPPEVIAGLLREFQVVTPRPTPPVEADTAAWAERQTVSVRRLRPEQFRAFIERRANQANTLLLSAERC